MACSALLLNCSFKKPAVEQPAPSNNNDFNKAFFVNSEGKPKTFLCGWASLQETGDVKQYRGIRGYNIAGHCNVQFRITEKKLIASMINPSFVNEPERWQDIFHIPIQKHYYLEKEKDKYGRETQKIVENSSRSHWSARPKIKLDFSGLQITKNQYKTLHGLGTGTMEVKDISSEVKEGKNFLAFTAMNTSTFGTLLQGAYRFNFIEFQHDPSFKRVPYQDANSRYVNVLHVMGKKADGINQLLYATRWDLKSKELPHKIRLFNFPAEYVDMGHDMIKEWNIALTKAVNPEVKSPRKNFKKYFEAYASNEGHAFDLRHHTFSWISDKEVSSYSPLGIAMVSADVRNGKALWGGVVMYAGMMERYLKRFYPTDADANESAKGDFSLSLGKGDFVQELAIGDLPKHLISPPEIFSSLGRAKEVLQGFEPNLVDAQALDQIAQDFSASLEGSLNNVLNDFSNRQSLLKEMGPKELFGFDINSTSIAEDDNSSDEGNDKLDMLNPAILDLDRRFVDVAAGWASAMKENSNGNYLSVLRSMLKFTAMHEIGHMLGLGHQFKGNIVPKRGTVPSFYIDGDPNGETNVEKQGLKSRATKRNRFTNYTSVMDYPNPHSEVATLESDIHAGPHDILALRYIYRGEYPTFKKGDKDFTFHKVDASGKIPPMASDGRRTAFFPSCNDWEASLFVDPFCSRFDQGSSPKEIVESHFRGLKDNLVGTLFSFVSEGKSSPWTSEQYLWRKSLNTASRVRLFYDYMRHKYADDIASFSDIEKNIYDFYPTCSEKISDNDTLNSLFAEKPLLKELCQVNGQVIEEFQTLMSLNTTDYTRFDKDSYFFPSGLRGGDTSWNNTHFLGAWKEMTSLPLKISSLYSMTTSTPFFLLPGGGMMRSLLFADVDTRYSFASLYPLEYTKAISAAVVKNIRVGTEFNNTPTTVGRLALAAGGYAASNYYSNDTNRFPEGLLERLRNQTRLRVEYAAVFLTPHANDSSDSTKVSHFSANLLNFQTQKETPLGTAFMLPGRNFIVKGSGNTMLLPASKVHFFASGPNDKGTAYGFVLKVEFDHERRDMLSASNIKTALKELYDEIYDRCIFGSAGEKNGLSHYFNDKFEGFDYAGNIGGQKLKQEEFFTSVDQAFDRYYEEGVEGAAKPSRKTCVEARRGIKAVVSTAAALQGYFLGYILDVMEKN